METPRLMTNDAPGSATGLRALSAHTAFRWVGNELLWGLDVWTRLTASVFILQAVSQVLGKWFLPQDLWDESPRILEGFEKRPRPDGGEESHAPSNGKPSFVFEFVGWRFYRHEDVFEGQHWPCPLRLVEPCGSCEWFVRGSDGTNYCAAVAKLRTRHHEHYGRLDLYDIRDEMKQQYQQPAAASSSW
jgi:hypothetical protein